MLIERLTAGRRALFGGTDGCSPTSKLAIAAAGMIVGGSAQYIVRRLWVEPWISDVLEEREEDAIAEAAVLDGPVSLLGG